MDSLVSGRSHTTTKVIRLLSEDSSNQSGDDVDPIPYVIGVVGVVAVFVGVNNGTSVEQAVAAGGAVLLVGAVVFFGLQKYGEGIVQHTIATIQLLWVTKKKNMQYWWNNPWRRPLRDAGRAQLSARREQARKLGQTALTKIRSHPSTPFEQPGEQSSDKTQLEALDDE